MANIAVVHQFDDPHERSGAFKETANRGCAVSERPLGLLQRPYVAHDKREILNLSALVEYDDWKLSPDTGADTTIDTSWNFILYYGF